MIKTSDMKIIRVLLLCTALITVQGVYEECSAQKWSLATNAVEWLNLGTMNIEGSVAVARKITVNVGTRYNPWTYAKGTDHQFQNRKKAFKAGIRYWPWYVYSGWWIEVDAQYMEYNRGGIFSSKIEEGDAFGGVLSFGYSLMLTKNWNIEFGAGVWGGFTEYTSYDCPVCGRVTDKGRKNFILPDDLKVSMVFTF